MKVHVAGTSKEALAKLRASICRKEEVLPLGIHRK